MGKKAEIKRLNAEVKDLYDLNDQYECTLSNAKISIRIRDEKLEAMGRLLERRNAEQEETITKLQAQNNQLFKLKEEANETLRDMTRYKDNLFRENCQLLKRIEELEDALKTEAICNGCYDDCDECEKVNKETEDADPEVPDFVVKYIDAGEFCESLEETLKKIAECWDDIETFTFDSLPIDIPSKRKEEERKAAQVICDILGLSPAERLIVMNDIERS